MKSIQEELASATLGAEYAYLHMPPPFAGRLCKIAFELYCRMLFRFYCPVTVHGRDRLPSRSFIFCSNHNSHMDSGVLMHASGLGFRNFAMMAAKDYFFENRKRKYFLSLLMNLIPIDRNANRQAMIEFLVACREFARFGTRNLIIYPEGTRSRTGDIQPFKKGPAMAAVELGMPIVPAYIRGSFRAWPKGRKLMRPRRIQVCIGEAILPSTADGQSAVSERMRFEEYRRITSALEQSIHELQEHCPHG